VTDDNRVAVLAPLFNDWACLEEFLRELSPAAAAMGQVSVLIVDDGSTEATDLSSLVVPDAIASLEILHLGCNLGHQRAIAVGLVEATRRQEYDAVIVIDSDGEDRPQDAIALWQRHQQEPDSIIVAQRQQRSEAIRFKMFYWLYKRLFRMLTGRDLDFGNYSLLPRAAAERMVLMAELWNHYPATVMRSKVSIIRVPLDRQPRYAGRSRMNFTSLVNHGLAAIAAFIDTAFARLLVVAVSLTVVFGLVAVAAVILRLVTSVPIPGWAALGGSVAFIGLVQVLAALVVVSFLTLSARSTSSPPPSQMAGAYLARVERVR
jgi:glycosyltransferase involved in cell wall biosynthesis